MKTTPAPIDREAATLFQAVAGMRLAYFHTVNGREKHEWCRVRDTGAGVYGPPGAIDTDDPATVGVMLAQVRAAANDPALHVVAGEPDLDGLLWWSVPRRFAGRSALSRTEGAALVAAMRALRATSS